MCTDGPNSAPEATVVVPMRWTSPQRRTSGLNSTLAPIDTRAGSSMNTPAVIQAVLMRRRSSAAAAASWSCELTPAPSTGCAATAPTVMPVTDQHADDVGEVPLPLDVVVGERRQRLVEHRRIEGVHRGVDLGDRPLLLGGVAVLDDGGDLTGDLADHAAVAGGIGQVDAEHRGGGAGGGVAVIERGDGLRADQRHVAGQDDNHVARVEALQPDGGGVARAELLGLMSRWGVGWQGSGYLVRLVADHHHDLSGTGVTGDPVHPRPPGAARRPRGGPWPGRSTSWCPCRRRGRWR